MNTARFCVKVVGLPPVMVSGSERVVLVKLRGAVWGLKLFLAPSKLI